MTILLTTHRLDEADRLSHRIGIMDNGRLRAQGTPDELRAQLGPTEGSRSPFPAWWAIRQLLE